MRQPRSTTAALSALAIFAFSACADDPSPTEPTAGSFLTAESVCELDLQADPVAVFLTQQGVLGPAEDFEGLWIDWPEKSPISEASDAKLVAAVREAEGRVGVAFKEPDAPRAAATVTLRTCCGWPTAVPMARIFPVKASSIEAGRNVVCALGGRITRPYRSLPMVSAVVDPEVVPELRDHPLVSWVEPSDGGGSVAASTGGAGG